MYTLLTRTILKNYRVSNKSIKRKSVILNDLNSLMLLPLGSTVVVFYEQSISLSYLLDLKSALNLNIIVAVNSEKDETICKKNFTTRLVKWDFIDSELITAVTVNDEKQMSVISERSRIKPNPTQLPVLVEAAQKMSTASGGSETNKMMAAAFLNLVEDAETTLRQKKEMEEQIEQLATKNTALETSLSSIAKDMDDFIKAFKQVQTQISSRNVIDVMRDTSTVHIPNITSLVIKNYGVPHLMRFVMALRDALTRSYDKYTKVVYIAEPDSISIQEINRNQFFQMTVDTKASDLLKHDLLLCIGNTKEPLEFLTQSSTVDVLIIIDSRRTKNDLITGQTLTLYTAMDMDMAMNLGLEPSLTITGSERSMYTIRESDFIGKKLHALRNNDLVTSVANTLLGNA